MNNIKTPLSVKEKIVTIILIVGIVLLFAFLGQDYNHAQDQTNGKVDNIVGIQIDEHSQKWFDEAKSEHPEAHAIEVAVRYPGQDNYKELTFQRTADLLLYGFTVSDIISVCDAQQKSGQNGLIFGSSTSAGMVGYSLKCERIKL